MLPFRLTITSAQRQALQRRLKTAETRGDLRLVKWILALLAVAHDQRVEHAAQILDLSATQIKRYVRLFLIYGVTGVRLKRPTGRKAKLSKAQKQELASLIEAGPAQAGFSGGCWRSPMIQQLIFDRFGVSYSVFYIAELLKNLGFSFQKARFVSDHLDELRRREWREQTWPEILRLAQQRKALLLLGDEASFPQWGTLTYTWARKGQQPCVKTSGKRKSYKVLGLIDYFTGRSFYSATTLRLESETYRTFLEQVLEETTQFIVLVQDGARYHTSRAMQQFFAQHTGRLKVYQFPSYSPDFNPIERLWKKIKQQETHLHYFATFEVLVQKVNAALVKFANRSEEILALFGSGADEALAA